MFDFLYGRTTFLFRSNSTSRYSITIRFVSTSIFKQSFLKNLNNLFLKSSFFSRSSIMNNSPSSLYWLLFSVYWQFCLCSAKYTAQQAQWLCFIEWSQWHIKVFIFIFPLLPHFIIIAEYRFPGMFNNVYMFTRHINIIFGKINCYIKYILVYR